jgi:hypothetical protein
MHDNADAEEAQSGAMTSDMEDGECVDCSTCIILKIVTVVKHYPETRGVVDEAAVEETIPASCETSLRETILPGKNSPSVREATISCEKMSGLESEF